MRKKLSIFITLALATFVATGCDALDSILHRNTNEQTEEKQEEEKKESEVAPAKSIKLDYQEITLDVGEQYQIEASVLPKNANQGLKYASFNTSICTVSTSGLVTALSGGETNIKIESVENENIYEYLAIIVNEETPECYTVTFNANNGSGEMEPQLTNGSEYITPACEFVYTDHDFDGWALNSPSATPKLGVGAELTGITSDIVLYATWVLKTTPVTNHTVTFDANGGTSAMAPQTTTGSTYVTPACTFVAPQGQMFKQWALNSTTGTKYPEGSTIYGITSDITLYAIWEELVINYTVSFDANGGSGTMASKTTTGSTYVTPQCTFVAPQNNSFKAWALNSTSGTTYTAGTTITEISSDITLYAIWQENSSSNYYGSITATSGISLLGQLHDLSVEKHTYYNSYSGDISTTNCMKTDPYQNSSYVMDFYSGAPTKNQVTSSGDSGWNREHVWCQNLSHGLFGTSGAGADIQHIRPTIPKLNSDRGNKKYGELNNSGTASTSKDVNGNTVYGGYYTSDTYQPMPDKKGDAARIVMYLYMHYNKANTVGGKSTDKSYFGTLNFTYVMAPNTESAAIQLLLSWNASDPVDDIERNRNEEASKITGCRNPFIDHPEYASMIWGN